MNDWTPQQVAQAARATLIASSPSPSSQSVSSSASLSGPGAGPRRVTIDSRDAGPGALFVGLPGASHDGGAFAGQALAAGAWGTLTSRAHAEAAAGATSGGAVLAAPDPLRALQSLATAWRRLLGARVIGVTGSTGKTSTKDLLLALLAPHRRTVASRSNFNTEIGLPLEILGAPAGTEIMVLEMGMRGMGQIAELAAIAEPDVAVIVSIGPVHLELLGTVEAVAAAKAELIAALAPGDTAVVPAGERLLDSHLRSDVRTVTFGNGGDVRLRSQDDAHVVIDAEGERIELEVPFRQAHLRHDLLAAVAAALAVGVTPSGRVAPALSAGRGETVALAGGITIIDGCYNANPMSMRAALSDLAATAEHDGAARRVAVLGDMLELGRSGPAYHRELGELVTAAGVDLLVTVGPLAAEIAERYAGEVKSLSDSEEAARVVPGLLQAGDVVLIKGSLGVGLRRVCAALGMAGHT
jgi:UDP-N-acetylmuramoyl-tripeptide--D-alanyl-D-alanine ligase